MPASLNGMRGVVKFRLLILLLALVATPSLASAAATSVSVDFTARGRPISPLIFGVSFGNAARNAQIGYTLDRWGGNSVTRYNWQADIHNTANDWFFENVRDCTAPGCIGSPPAGNSADNDGGDPTDFHMRPPSNAANCNDAL
jgi:hypothetical protein